MNTSTEYTIGQLASEADVNVETVRYYQRIGLIKKPGKPDQGFRKYPRETLEQLFFIKRAQQLGFNLTEISELLDINRGCCSDVRQRAEQKREKIRNQISDLQNLEATLTGLIGACNAGDENQECPIVEALSKSVG